MNASRCHCMDEEAVAQGASEVVEEGATLLRPHFAGPQAHRHAADYLQGLLADVERKNGWQLAEQAGYRHPRGIQRVLDRYAWDADGVRDDLRRYVVAELGEPDGILVVDETGFPKQGSHSVGVARQYSGTLGKIGNCQIGVFLGYVSSKGHVALDRELFLPQAWSSDRPRCRRAGVPEDIEHQTKPQLAVQMLERALDGGVPTAWVTGDEVYGSDGTLRRRLEERGMGYVLAVRSNQAVTMWPPYGSPNQTHVTALAATVSVDAWQRLSCGDGAQGPRLYDWAWLPLRPALRDGWVHSLLLRRHPQQPEDVAYYLVYAREPTTFAEVVQVAGARWSIDDLFKLAKGQVGLDHYEVRSWQGWYRHITLALLAFAVLTVAARKKGGLRAQPIFRSRSPRSDGSSFGCSGPRSGAQTRLWRGPAGADIIKRSPRIAINAAA
jgi:SRSO17 transposase